MPLINDYNNIKYIEHNGNKITKIYDWWRTTRLYAWYVPPEPPTPPTPGEFDWDFTDSNYTIEQLEEYWFTFSPNTVEARAEWLYWDSWTTKWLSLVKKISDVGASKLVVSWWWAYDSDIGNYWRPFIRVSWDDSFLNCISLELLGWWQTKLYSNWIEIDSQYQNSSWMWLEVDFNTWEYIVKDSGWTITYFSWTTNLFERMGASLRNWIYVTVNVPQSQWYNRPAYISWLSYSVTWDTILTPTISHPNACWYYKKTLVGEDSEAVIVTLVDDNWSPYKTFLSSPILPDRQYSWWHYFKWWWEQDVYLRYLRFWTELQMYLENTGREPEDWTSWESTLLPLWYHIPTQSEMESLVNYIQSFSWAWLFNSWVLNKYMNNNKYYSSYATPSWYVTKDVSDNLSRVDNWTYSQESRWNSNYYMWLSWTTNKGLKVTNSNIQPVTISDLSNSFLQIYVMKDTPAILDDTRTKIAY